MGIAVRACTDSTTGVGLAINAVPGKYDVRPTMASRRVAGAHKCRLHAPLRTDDHAGAHGSGRYLHLQQLHRQVLTVSPGLMPKITTIAPTLEQ